MNNQCPFCGKSDMSKDQLAKEIMKLIGYDKDFTWCGAFNKEELRAILEFLKQKKEE